MCLTDGRELGWNPAQSPWPGKKRLDTPKTRKRPRARLSLQCMRTSDLTPAHFSCHAGLLAQKFGPQYTVQISEWGTLSLPQHLFPMLVPLPELVLNSSRIPLRPESSNALSVLTCSSSPSHTRTQLDPLQEAPQGHGLTPAEPLTFFFNLIVGVLKLN